VTLRPRRGPGLVTVSSDERDDPVIGFLARG
jgi:hypothetical protein